MMQTRQRQSATDRQYIREAKLKDFVRRITSACRIGVTGERIDITSYETIPGPRAGAIHLFAGLKSAKLLKALTTGESTLARMFIPWDPPSGRITVYMHKRWVRIEAGWDKNLERDVIPLHSLTLYPIKSGAWAIGQDERGRTIRASLNEGHTPHYLFGGTTGSGKTEAILSALTQFSIQANTRLVIVDGKRGGLGRGKRPDDSTIPMRFGNMVGPATVDPHGWINALSWVDGQMDKRRTEGWEEKLVVVIDELPEVVQIPQCLHCVSRIATLGRDAGVHMIVAAQHPTVKNVGGDMILRCIPGRLGLLVTDHAASRVVAGDAGIELHHLMGKGDSWAISPMDIFRNQGGYASKSCIQHIDRTTRVDMFGPPELEAWPDAEGVALGEMTGRPSPWPESDHVAASLIAAYGDSGEKQYGRPTFENLLEEFGCSSPGGTTRTINVMKLGRRVLKAMRNWGWDLSPAPLTD